MNELTHIDEAAKAFEVLGLVPVMQQQSYEALLGMLSQRVNKMIVEDFEGLVQILYRIDIPEQKLRSVLQSHATENAGNIIAGMVIDRQLKKIITRQAFRRNEDITEDEKW